MATAESQYIAASIIVGVLKLAHREQYLPLFVVVYKLKLVVGSTVLSSRVKSWLHVVGPAGGLHV